MMTTGIARVRLTGKVTRAASLCLLALAAVFAQPRAARAQWATSGNDISNTNVGNVGIGTTTPNQKLGLQGMFGLYPTPWVPPSARGMFMFHTGNGGSIYAFNYPDGTGDPIGLSAMSFTFSTYTGTSGIERMTLTNEGNLGIGTNAPAARLDVTADNSASSSVTDVLRLSHATTGTAAAGIGTGISFEAERPDGIMGIIGGIRGVMTQLGTGQEGGDLSFVTRNLGASSEKMRILANGNLGIGTSSPNQKLGVQGMLGLYPQPWVMPTTRGMFMLHTGGGGSIYAFNYPAGTGDPISMSAATISLSTYIGGTPYERLFVANNGYVGIGTNTPASALHVLGDITVTGNVNAKYQDVAEWVPTTQKLAAGTVVVLDPVRSNHVLASTASYDTAVAGVVSERPGLALGEAGEGKALVATTGRVKVRVDATRAAIKIGDLIVTSDVPGVAMKSKPVNVGGRRIHAPGTIIGKALEPLEKGTGEILVLLSLQ